MQDANAKPETTKLTPEGFTRQGAIEDAIDACHGALDSLRKRRVVQAISALRRAVRQAEAAEALEQTSYENQL